MSIDSTCRLLGLSRQVYYRAKRSGVKKQKRAEQVVNLVHSIRSTMPRLGTRKLYYLLQDSL